MYIPVLVFSCCVRNDFKLGSCKSHIYYFRVLWARSWGSMWLGAGSQVSSGWILILELQRAICIQVHPCVWLKSGRGPSETEEPLPLLAVSRELPLVHRCHPVLCHLLPFILIVSFWACNSTQNLWTSNLLQKEELRLFEGFSWWSV